MTVQPDAAGNGAGAAETAELRAQVEQLQARVQRAEERRRALLHIMGDLHVSNRKLGEQRRAMLHILKDSHESNLRLENSRKAMIHIMGDLRETAQELRDKQEQLVQAGKLATLGELTTGVAHELNNPLNNIGLFIGNVIDHIELGRVDPERIKGDLGRAVEQVRKATEIITHLRTFGRPAPVQLERVDVDDVITRSLSLMQEQLRMRAIDVSVHRTGDLHVLGNAIQLEQVFINLLTNARDALADADRREVAITAAEEGEKVGISVSDTGPGIPPEVAQRIFDPFFTTKEVGGGTGLGLSITYSIVKEHGGQVWVDGRPGEGAVFHIELPRAREQVEAEGGAE
jgi:C4-dicarboxylate-specific signal transduction histidine kinase